MSRLSTRRISVVCIVAIVLTGCHPTQPFYFHEDGDLSHYVGRATQIEEPDVEVESLADVKFSTPPLTPGNVNLDNVWELTLDEAIKISLSNATVLKTLGAASGVGLTQSASQFGGASASDRILLNPEAANTIFNPALSETSTGLSGFTQIPGSFSRGPEAALADFDASFSANMLWQRNDDPNNVGVVNLGRRLATVQDLGTFNAQIRKVSATGGSYSILSTTTYDQSNIDTQFRPFPSEFRTQLTGEVRQPLLAGAGVQYNRIAGPIAVRGRGYSGVLMSRLDVDRSIADFELAIRNHVRDVERAYWNLYQAYCVFDINNKYGKEPSLAIWKMSKARKDVGAGGTGEQRGGQVGDEERAREQYYSSCAQTQQALCDLIDRENRLRYMMGLAASDGRLIRPADEPIVAKVILDWQETLAEALARSPELRKIKWNIEKSELAAIAAKNQLLPRLDAVARYRWQGFGDRLIDPGNGFNATGNAAADAFRRRFDNAVGNLLDGDFQEWELGFEFEIPLGLRRELSEVRHRQLALARDKAILKEAELELSHLLADRVRQLVCQYGLFNTYFNQIRASEDEISKFRERFASGQEANDRLLDAQIRGVQAHLQYVNSLVTYNQVIADIHFHKGSLLEQDNVFLAEGPWPGKAYFDAVRLARQRDASMYMNYGTTQPGVISRGPTVQHARPNRTYDAVPADEDNSTEDMEELPLPEPEAPNGEQREEPQPEEPQPGLRFTHAVAPQANFRRGTASYAVDTSVLANDSASQSPAAGQSAAGADSPAHGDPANGFRR